jgi:hypothetical protein
VRSAPEVLGSSVLLLVRNRCRAADARRRYDAEALYFDLAVREAKHAELLAKMLAALQPVYTGQVSAGCTPQGLGLGAAIASAAER